MKITKFLRDVILMLYVCVFILCLICYFLGISATPVTSANQFANIEVGNLVLFRSGEFFGSLPWFGYAAMWIKTIPGIIISSLFTILVFGTFIFEVIKDKKNKKKNKDFEVIEEKSETEEVKKAEDVEDVNEFTEEDIDKAKNFFSKGDEHIENEQLIKEFDEQRLEDLNASVEEVKNNIEDNVKDDAEEFIENNEDVVENIEDIVKEKEVIVEDNDNSITNGKDETNMNTMFDNDKDLNFDESILDKYSTENMDDVENKYMDNAIESLPNELIENIEKKIDDKVYETKHEVEELSQIPDSINRDTTAFEELLKNTNEFEEENDDIEYCQMTLAELEAAKDDPILMSMDFPETKEIPNNVEIPSELMTGLKKELELKNEEVRILIDKLTSLENIEIAEVSTKLKIAENEKSELAKEVSLKDEVIAELNENLNTYKTHVKEVENALNIAIDEREDFKAKLNNYKDTIDKYNLMYERYISTIEYLVNKGLASKASIDRERDTFNLNV